MISMFLSRVLCGILAILMWSVTVASTQPPPLQHAGTYTGDETVTGWLMSEKLDGIRGYWDGARLLTRKGRTIYAPKWFTEHFPPFALDGELWRRRGDFAFVQQTVLDETPSDDWKKITYRIFEVPEASGDFPARLAKAAAWFDAHPAAHVRIIEQVVCQGAAHLDNFLKAIESLGGEGVIVKNPAPEYHAGRSPYILKVKNFSDMEGKVIARNPGRGKFGGMMGSLTLRLENGVVFSLGSGFSTAERRHPPPIGAIVTFKFTGFTANGIPRFASFLRVRKD
jgi:DNA ligase-1